MTTHASTIVGTAEKRNIGLIAVIGAAMFVTTFDITAIIMIMPRVKEDLALDIGGFAWLMDSYSLAFTVFLMTAGVLADRYGRRRGFLIGNVIFLAASLLCVLASSEAVLLLGRTAQGLGAAFVVCSGLAVLGHRYVDPAERATVFGWLGTVNGAAMALGPAGGGMIAESFGWHWVFFINVPICLAILLGTMWTVDESRDPARRRIDVWGVLSLTSFLVSAVWLLLHGPRIGAFDVPLWAALSLVLVLGVAFLLSQRYGERPLLELELFSSRAFIGLCLVPLVLSVAYWAALIYLPLFLQERLGSSLSDASFLMLAATAPMVVFPMLSARVAKALNTRRFFCAGLIVVACGGFAIAAGAQAQSLPLALAGMAVAGAGTAVLNPQMVSKLVGLVPREQAGAVSAVTIILRQGGFALGIALLGGLLRTLRAESAHAGGFEAYTLVFGVAGLSAALSAGLIFALLGTRAEQN